MDVKFNRPHIMKTHLMTLAALTCSLHIASAGENLIKNGDFSEKPIKPWKVFSVRSTKKAEIEVKDGVLSLTMEYATGKTTRRQLSQLVPEVKSNSKYKLTFDAKASSKPAEITATLARSKDWDKGHYGFLRKLELSSEWKSQTIYFKTKEIEPDNTPAIKFLYGTMKGTVSFRNVKLIAVKQK